MKIFLAPVRAESRLALARAGDVLTFNGEAVDISAYQAPDPDGGSGALGCPWIVGAPVAGPDGWEVTIVFPYGPGAPESALFPAPVVNPADGPVKLPPADGGAV